MPTGIFERTELTKEKIRKSRIGKKHSLKTKEKMSLSQIGKPKLCVRGNKHGNWKGGITSINRTIRSSLEYKLWRKSIFERDNFTCIWCGLKSGVGKTVTLHADHIKPFAYYPELRFAIDNGRTLCVECHRKTDSFGKRVKIYEKF